jgi:alpha/beta superfamily hydrolase
MRSGSPDPSVFSEQTHKSAGLDLGTALLRASHAESLQGGTADLLTILERTNKAAGYSYGDVERPVKIWHGLKDDKISLNSVIGLESSMQDCKVTIIPGADHSLMTNVPVIVQVLNSIASEWRK